MTAVSQARDLVHCIKMVRDQKGDYLAALDDALVIAQELLTEARDAVPYPLGESVTFTPSIPSSEDVPATGWMKLGDLEVCLTRRYEDGRILVSLESTSEEKVPAEVILQQGIDIWKGEV